MDPKTPLFSSQPYTLTPIPRHFAFPPDAQWEVRHGACMALRDVLRHHAESAGKTAGDSRAQQEEDRNDWLAECTVRLLCVLALDRFGDYVSDQVMNSP